MARLRLDLAVGLMLASACATTPLKPSTRADLTCENLQEADGSTKLGDFVEVACSCGSGEACEIRGLLLRKEGGTANLEAAARYLAEACRLGVASACEPSRP